MRYLEESEGEYLGEGGKQKEERERERADTEKPDTNENSFTHKKIKNGKI